MFSLLRDLFTRKASAQGEQALQQGGLEPPPSEVGVDGAPGFPIAQHIVLHDGYPIIEWSTAQSWVSEITSVELQGSAWSAVQRAWLLHMRGALGPKFRLHESSNAMLLSSLEANVARATLEYMGRTLQRVIKLLDGIARMPSMGKDLLLVFDDDEAYYRYVSF